VTGPLPVLTGGLAAVLVAGAAARVPATGQAELVVRNESFSTLAITVVDAERREAVIGQAPPEFTNTLYVPADGAPARVRFRARLRGGTDILYESETVQVREGTKLRWTLPDNVLETVHARHVITNPGDGTPVPRPLAAGAPHPPSRAGSHASRG